MMLYTTLNDIRKYFPCEGGWVKLLKSLNKTSPDDEPLSFKTILGSNGFDDTIWCLRCVSGHEKEIRLYAVWCARQTEHLDKTGIARQTNDISEKFANGQATKKKLAAARAAASAAASDTSLAAASATSLAAASAAARAAASATSLAAARAAARAAASAPSLAAARATASAAAFAAARATSLAAVSAAAREAQKQEFIKQFCTEE